MSRSWVIVALACALFVPPLAASSFDRQQPDALPSIADIVEKVSPPVVNIVSESRPKHGALTPLELFFGMRGRNNVIPKRGEGSGFVIDAKGLILTAAHVVDDATSLTVNMANGRKYKAKVKASDSTHDVAVLELEQPVNPPLAAEQIAKMGDSDKARVGDWVIAIGSPFSLKKTVTKGIVSGLGRHLTIQGKQYLNLLQTDALINPGNSGGPLLNLAGEVIGINVAINPQAQGIGFAIPINTVKRIAEDLIAHGKYQATWLGVNIAALTEEQAKEFGIGNLAGVLVQRVLPNSPASKAGLKAGDLITQVNGQRIESPVDLKLRIEAMKAGEKAAVTVLRGGKEQPISVDLEVAPDDGATHDTDDEATPDEPKSEARGGGLAGLGLRGRAVVAGDHDRLELPGDTKGVVITDVDESSRGSTLGVAVDDVIIWANGKDVDSPQALEAALRAKADSVYMKVWRRGALLFLQASL